MTIQMRANLNTSAMRLSWRLMIQRVERYFPGARVNDDVWEIKVSSHREWAYDMISKVWCNANGDGEMVEPYRPDVRYGLNRCYKFIDAEEHKEYRLVVRPYLNGVACIRIFIENC